MAVCVSSQANQPTDRGTELPIWESAAWLRLLHYETGSFALFNGRRSSIDDARFFLSDSGRRNAALEFQATLKAMQAPLVSAADDHAQCRFPARRAFILSVRPAAFVPIDCPAFENFKQQLNATGVRLMLAQGHLGNASSVFGHTFLRFEQDGQLLDEVLNFTADTRQHGPARVIWKGMTGGYRGRFKREPLYERLNEHQIAENRNIWEYPIQLSPAQLQQLVRHLWEIQNLDFVYFFMSHNCFTQQLALINAAAPEFDILEHIGFKVTPLQVLSILQQQTTLLGKPTLYPAPGYQLQFREAHASMSEVALAARLAFGEHDAPTFPQAGQQPNSLARSLELATDTLSLPWVKQTQSDHYRKLIAHRNAIDASKLWPATALPDAKPTNAHGSNRAGAGWLYSDQGGELTLSGRFIYHDWLDPRGANPWGTEVEMFSTTAAFDNGQAYIRTFEFLNLTDLKPRSKLVKPISSAVNIGHIREGRDKPSRQYWRHSRGFSWGQLHRIAFVLAEAQLQTSREFRKNWQTQLGLRFGAVWHLNHRWSLHTEISQRYGVISDYRSELRWRIRQQWSFNRQLGLRLSYDGWRERSVTLQSHHISIYWYW